MNLHNKGIIKIGTSGIVVPGKKESYPQEFQGKSRLSFYSSLFNTLEVNSTFHKLPRISTFEKWASEVPEEFQLTIKIWREITHVKKLNIDLNSIETFLKGANNIGSKKGCLLIQFPGSISSDYMVKVEEILQKLQELDPENEWRKAVEFRNISWYHNETYELLNKYKASAVLHDMPKSKHFELQNGGEFYYLRYHGPVGDYRGSYERKFLLEQARIMQSLLKEGKDVYAYFNNTMGDALNNALDLQVMVAEL